MLTLFFENFSTALFPVTSAYKDPVKNQNMKKIVDKIITGFFIGTLGLLWYCSTRYYTRQDSHKIVIYDIFGKPVNSEEIRTEFRLYQVAQSHITEYQKRFPQYQFSMAAFMPETRRIIFRKIRKIRDNAFSYEHQARLDIE